MCDAVVTPMQLMSILLRHGEEVILVDGVQGQGKGRN